MISGPEGSYKEMCSFCWKPLESEKRTDNNITDKDDCLKTNLFTYEGHLESKERSRIQPAQLFQCS
jgi:hypothetical protein